ncbi:flagellar filament capping protein FliD [Pseudomonas abietaniphila]|uniref:Flagellar hook-associated protein 2 n=1 Tax=Pseudomonas abietaniphila TaxID=89065 RepID=A0A1G8S6H2_9PSED|nr:flagellar filament capping protein FliD [Pseudomonas abietaniphila]SDJ24829.1 flagellar hook-associated protein 2 [Pseudomonas abietaniphila]
MAGSTVSGIGSNIDTQSIVTSLVNSAKAPKQSQINTQSLKATTTLTSIGKIQAALDAFRGAMTSMATDTSYGGLVGKSSNESVATMTAGSKASNGSFSLVVNQLASASKLSTASYKDGASAVVNKGTSPTTLTVSQGTKKYDLSVPVGATLQQVRDSLNSQFGTSGLSANLLTDSTGSRLIITSTTMGEGSDLTLSGNSGIDTGYTVVDKPQDAKYTIDGIANTSKSNSIDEAVSGISIKLLSVSPTASGATSPTATTISVTTSTTALKSAVKGFVDTYNALMTAINAETKITTNPDGSITAGALSGDSTMRSLTSAIRGELNTLSGSGTLKSLAQFGVTTSESDGTLSITDAKWDKAVATNAADISSIFTGSTGLLARMTAATDGFAKATTGVMAQRSTTLKDNLTDLAKQQDALNERMDALTKSLSDKYNAMDTLVAQLRQQSDSVLATLNALNKSKDN